MGFFSALGLAPDQANTEAGLRADAQNRELNRDLWNRGVLSDEQFIQSEQDFNQSWDQLSADHAVVGPFPEWRDNGTVDAGQAADESTFLGGQVQDSVSEMAKKIQGTSTGVVKNLFKLVPWPVWAALALYLAWPFLATRLARR
jgi:hypothetical protein